MITLEVSSTDIRLIEVTNGKVTKWGSCPLEPGVVKEEVISDPQAFGAAVRQLMDSNDIREKNVTASVSSLYSLSRMVTVPTPPEQSVTEQAVLEAAEEVMPLSQEEMYLSWQVIGPGQGGQQVLLIGMPRDVLDSEVRALKMVGINPQVLGLRTLALARVVNRKDALVLNIDAASFDVIMVVEGVAEMLRTTAWQPEALSIEERAEQLVSALNLTVSFYDTHHPGSPFNPTTPLFITGHLSGERTLTEQIRDEIKYPIEPLVPLLDYPEHMSISQYAVNAGLALKATTAPGMLLSFTRKSITTPRNVGRVIFSIPDINLLPRIYKPWRPSARQIYSFLALMVVLALFFPLYQLTTAAMKETSVMKQRFAAINTVLIQRKIELAKREPLQNAISQYNSIVAIGGGFVDDFTAIRNLATELDVKISAISHSGASITFNSEANSYSTFRDFIKALEDNGRFTTPIIPPEGYPYIKGGMVTLHPKR